MGLPRRLGFFKQKDMLRMKNVQDCPPGRLKGWAIYWTFFVFMINVEVIEGSGSF